MVGFVFYKLFVFLFGLLPFRVVYYISDFISWLLYNVIRYRRKVVEEQLKNSFPEKSDIEINKIAKKSYDNLSDIIVESIKGFTMTEATFMKRYIFTNPELANQMTAKGKNVIFATGHYNNWEWGVISIPLWFNDPSLGFYKPLSNRYMEAYAKKVRSKFGFIPVPIGETSQTIEQYKGKSSNLLFISDQNTWSKNALWVQFLGQDTICAQGIEKYTTMLEAPVFYLQFKRVARGYYVNTLIPLTDGTEKLPYGVITKRFMHQLEADIKASPENWLWSHKRWKRKREPHETLIG